MTGLLSRPRLASANGAPAPSAPASGSRLAGVDGLRAAAALWVVLFHIRVFSGAHLPLGPLDFFARSGSTGVSLFLVISGFCLYLPFAAGRQSRFKTGAFFVRRARRLLPAYYCSILFALALNLIGRGSLGFGPMSPADVGWQLFAHVAVIHTLFPSTFYALNGAYWSLGLEWELYLALPLLIIGARFVGLVPTLAAAVAVNVVYRIGIWYAGSHGLVTDQVLQTVVLPNLLPGRWAEFVFGMAAAELYARGTLERLATPWLYAWIPAMVVGALMARLPVSHLGFGAAFTLLLVSVLSHNGLTGRVFAWRPLVALGVMSYSLYLVHQPLVQAMAYLLRHDAHLGPTAAFAGLVLLFPVILAAAWLLFVLVERRTLTSRPVEVTGWFATVLFPRLPWNRSVQEQAVESPAA